MKNVSYQEFVDKFKPKKTTDDCYTPPAVYDAVLNWALENCAIPKDAKILRPFYPGGDYQSVDYSGNVVVVDNPPFSILAQICRWYNERGIRYFLFAPHLTLFGLNLRVTHIVVGREICYENGAKVNTGFVTNCYRDSGVAVLGSPELSKVVEEANIKSIGRVSPKLPKYIYPKEVLTVSRVAAALGCGCEISFRHEELAFCRCLDSQKAMGKALFGSGYLMSRAAAERAAAERAAAERATTERATTEWSLSEREQKIVDSLG